MSDKEMREKLGNGSELFILQKVHLVLIIIGMIAVAISSVLYSGNRLDRVEEDVKELKTKTEIINEMRSDIKHIQEGIQDIKDNQKIQQEAVKDFYKTYKLEKK